MITVKTTKNSRTYNSRELLKEQGFVFGHTEKVWSREFEDKKEFDDFEENIFRNPTYVGRKNVRLNSTVKFEIAK